ncbi:MAG: trigger factor [Christensenellales bacterium]
MRPDVTLGEYKNLTVEVELKEVVTEDEIQARISQDQQKGARTIDVTDRGVDYTDTVNLDYAGSVDGVPFEGGTAQGQTLKIGSGAFIPGFEEQMVGMTVGEEKDLNVTFPEKYHAENLAGKNAVFHVKVNSITKTELPELDDDFAQDNGFDTFDAYKADVAKKLQEIADTNYDVEIENALIEKAVANAQMDIPAAMIDDQLNYVMRDVEYSMMRQGLRMEDYLKYTGQTRRADGAAVPRRSGKPREDSAGAGSHPRAENIEPTAEDIDEQSAKQAKRAGQEVEAFKANLTDEHKAYLSDLAAIQKVCDLMKAGATVVDKKPEEAAETAEETKTEE